MTYPPSVSMTANELFPLNRRSAPAKRQPRSSSSAAFTLFSSSEPSAAISADVGATSVTASPDESAFNSIAKLFTAKKPQVARRLQGLHWDAIVEGERIRPDSMEQFVRFVIDHSFLGTPKIVLTPDGTVRARWLNSDRHFVALEFLGNAWIRVLAEVPRLNDGSSAQYYAYEHETHVVRHARDLGANFGS